MIDIKKVVCESIIKQFPNLFESYPQDFNKFPVITYLEEENTPYEYTSSYDELNFREASSKIVYSFSIYDLENTTDIAIGINDIMLELGFRRDMCRDIPNSNGYKQKNMRFSAIIDNDMKAIYFD